MPINVDRLRPCQKLYFTLKHLNESERLGRNIHMLRWIAELGNPVTFKEKHESFNDNNQFIIIKGNGKITGCNIIYFSLTHEKE